MTDLEKTLPMLRKNVEINRKYWKCLKGFCEIQKLHWGSEIDLDYEPEIILLTDCVYYEEVNLHKIVQFFYNYSFKF